MFWNAGSLQAVREDIAARGVREPFANLTIEALRAQAIAQLMDDPALRQRLGAAARLRAQQHFSLPAVAARLRKIYRHL